MPSFDRGFIKWQPFNSLISNKTVLDNLNNQNYVPKPILSEEQSLELNEKLIEAYYSKSTINIYYYEQNSIKNIETIIYKINTHLNIIEIKNNKKITFNQIIKIT